MNFLQKISHYKNEKESSSLERAIINSLYDKQLVSKSSSNLFLNIWIYGDDTSYNQLITHYSIGQHLRGLMPKHNYLKLGQFSFNTYEEGLQDKFKIAFGNNIESLIIRLGERKYEEISNGLDLHINSLPNYTGICYRILELDNSRVYSEYVKVNDLISDKSYLASSMFRGSGGKSSWSDFSFNAVAKFIITSKTGKYLHSNTNSEKEILFGKDTIFRVTNIIQKNNNVFYIYAKEISLPKNNVQVVKNIFTGLKY